MASMYVHTLLVHFTSHITSARPGSKRKQSQLEPQSGERLMFSGLASRSSGPVNPGSIPCRGHCVVFLGKTVNSHSASLQSGV